MPRFVFVEQGKITVNRDVFIGKSDTTLIVSAADVRLFSRIVLPAMLEVAESDDRGTLRNVVDSSAIPLMGGQTIKAIVALENFKDWA